MESYSFPAITYEEIDESRQFIIDVRSPEEYKEFHLPGSISLPLFSNEERKLIGTIYKQESRAKAKKTGMEIYARKLPAFYDEWTSLLKQHKGKTPVVTCARGGMRSGAFVGTMLSMKMPVRQLKGGMRAVRQHVLSRLDSFSALTWKTIVLGGLTGTGKTAWLRQLKEQGYPVLDLEGLADHRGSVFGHIGLTPKTQKQFEFELVQELQQCAAKNHTFIIEAESKRIGRITVPPFIISAKEHGSFIEIRDRMDRRIRHLMADYQPFTYQNDIRMALNKIWRRLPDQIKPSAEEALETGNYERLFELLLQHYYDRRYTHKQNGYVNRQEVRTVELAPLDDESILPAIEHEIDRLL